MYIYIYICIATATGVLCWYHFPDAVSKCREGMAVRLAFASSSWQYQASLFKWRWLVTWPVCDNKQSIGSQYFPPPYPQQQ